MPVENGANYPLHITTLQGQTPFSLRDPQGGRQGIEQFIPLKEETLPANSPIQITELDDDGLSDLRIYPISPSSSDTAPKT